jgi:hypothetical protein
VRDEGSDEFGDEDDSIKLRGAAMETTMAAEQNSSKNVEARLDSSSDDRSSVHRQKRHKGVHATAN